MKFYFLNLSIEIVWEDINPMWYKDSNICTNPVQQYSFDSKRSMQTYLLVILSLSLSSISGDPSVVWETDSRLKLELGDTTASIILTPVTSNIPGVKVDCLFSGKLDKDADSLVTVSGCKDDDEVTVSIASKLVPNGLIDFLMAGGKTSVIEEYNTSNGTARALEYENDVLEPPAETGAVAAVFSGTLPQAVTLRTVLWYDRSLLGKFGNNHDSTKQWLSRMVELAKPRLAEPSLQIKVNIVIERASYISRTMKADYSNIRALARYNVGKINSYFCYDLGGGILGIAYVGTACRTDGYAVNINEYFQNTNSELTSARVWVHELGHNVGMRL